MRSPVPYAIVREKGDFGLGHIFLLGSHRPEELSRKIAIIQGWAIRQYPRACGHPESCEASGFSGNSRVAAVVVPPLRRPECSVFKEWTKALSANSTGGEAGRA